MTREDRDEERRPTVGSLFAGIGGFDLAFERAGFEIAWHVELDEACRGVLGRRFGPGRPIFSDVRTLGAGDLAAVDVLVGGWPCQPVSVAGRRRASSDERDMWPEFARLARELRPAWVVGENVPGVLTAEGGSYWRRVVDDLRELGYGLAWRTLDAQYFGVPQRRRRIFVVGRLGDLRGPVAVLLDGASGDGDPSPREQAGAIASGALARSVGGVGGGQDFGANKGTLVKGDQDPLIFAIYGQGADLAARETVAPPIAATLSSASNPNSNAPARRREDAVNLVGLAEASVRRLTPTECERLQGFPDGWTAGQSDSARYRQLGNAVAVPCVEWIARRLLAVERGEVE